jgi:hypothetical protein
MDAKIIILLNTLTSIYAVFEIYIPPSAIDILLNKI